MYTRTPLIVQSHAVLSLVCILSTPIDIPSDDNSTIYDPYYVRVIYMCLPSQIGDHAFDSVFEQCERYVPSLDPCPNHQIFACLLGSSQTGPGRTIVNRPGPFATTKIPATWITSSVDIFANRKNLPETAEPPEISTPLSRCNVHRIHFLTRP